MNFNDAELLTYTSQNNFLSDGDFRYGSTKVISIDSYIDTRYSNTDQSGVKEFQQEIMTLISGANDFEKIIINGHDFGYGRIKSINYNGSNSFDSNQIRLGKNTFEIEISDSGDQDLHNMDGDHFAGLKNKFSKHHLLEDFGESFSFSNSEDGTYSYTHNVNAKYFSGAEVTDPIEEAKSLAEGIFELDPSFGFLNSQRSGFYNADGKKRFSESYNLRNNSCSFTKNFTCHPKYNKGDTFCSDISHVLTSDENGIISVTESATVMGLDDDGGEELYTSVLNGLENEIINSYSRCTGVLSGYSGFYGGDNTDGAILNDLNKNYISLQKNLNKTTSNLSYEVVYNNNNNISGNLGQHSLSLSLDTSTEGITSVVEQGSITSLSQKGNVTPMTLYNSFYIDENSPHKCGKFYSGTIDNNRNEYNFFQQKRFNLIDSDISYSRKGNKVSYSKLYTDDPSVINTSNISSLKIDCSDVFEIEINNQYFIPNQPDQKVILQKKGLTTLSSRNVNASCIYQKPSTNFWTDSTYAPIAPESNTDFYNALKFIKNKMLEKAFDDEWVSIDEINSMYVSDFSYNVSSDQNLSATMNIVYESK